MFSGELGRSRPVWAATTTTSGGAAAFRRAVTARPSASLPGRNRYPPRFSGFSHIGTAGVVMPMTATRTPLTLLTR